MDKAIRCPGCGRREVKCQRCEKPFLIDDDRPIAIEVGYDRLKVMHWLVLASTLLNLVMVYLLYLVLRG